jgi:hypothetical protein
LALAIIYALPEHNDKTWQNGFWFVNEREAQDN